MARAAIPGGLKVRRTWRPAHLVEQRRETESASTLVLEVTGWPGHLAGQHIDVRLTAPDGYQAARSYSLAAPADGDRIEITVQRVPDGEVSSYLADEVKNGDTVEVRGPVGGWFVWKPGDSAPVVLVAGGSGVVPLMAMIRSRDGVNSTPFRLIYSVRTPDDRIYDRETSPSCDSRQWARDHLCLHRAERPRANAFSRADNRRRSPQPRLAARLGADLLRLWAHAIRRDGGGSVDRPRAQPDTDPHRTVRADRPMIMR